MRTVVVAAVLVVLALGGVVLAVALARDEAPPALSGPVPFSERPAPGEQAALPDMTLDGFADGAPVALGAYRGRPLVVNFWATWCGPCVEEMPAFQEVATDLDEQVAFLGVDTRDAPAPAERFVADLGITYDLAADPEGTLGAGVGVFGLPTTLFVDPDGTIVHRATAPLDAEQLRAALRDHLGIP